jgi:hypothetical protein
MWNVHDFRNEAAPFRLEEKKMKKTIKTVHLKSTRNNDDVRIIELSKSTDVGLQFIVDKFLGGGTYGAVFCLKEKLSQSSTVAIKIEKGTRHLPWEFHIIK